MDLVADLGAGLGRSLWSAQSTTLVGDEDVAEGRRPAREMPPAIPTEQDEPGPPAADGVARRGRGVDAPHSSASERVASRVEPRAGRRGRSPAGRTRIVDAAVIPRSEGRRRRLREQGVEGRAALLLQGRQDDEVDGLR